MGGGIIRWAIARPVSVTVGVILIILFGALSVAGIPIQLTPDVTVPAITVSTQWPGATPAEIEAEILEEQEEALKSLRGLERMRSEGRMGVGTVELELAVGTPMEEALVRVTNLLSQVPEYPDTARRPVITTANSTGPPLAVVVIQSRPPGREIAEFRTWIDETIVPRFERIPGVAGVRFVGGRDQEIHVNFDPDRLAARRITVGRIAERIRAELRDMSAGDFPVGKRQYVVRTQVAPDVPEKLERVVLSTDAAGTPILLGQVAEVKSGLRKRTSLGMVSGDPSMAMLLYREAGSNVLEVTREIHRVVQELDRDHMAPEGLEMRVVSDQTSYIEGALDLVQNNLLLGGALAILVLLFFLRSAGASAVVALSIPISIVGTGLAMSLMGRTVNIVSLAGMAFAVGMVVDNSIVVLENIDTWRGKERDVKRAALMGTREVWGAILASTLTTAAVFVPIIGWQDEVGELLRDVAVAVSTAVFVSLLVSVVVIPSFSAKILRGRGGGKAPASDPDLDTGRGRRIGSIVSWLVRSPARSVAVALVGVFGIAALGLALVPAMEYLPTGNRNVVFGFVIPPPGTSIEELDRIGDHLEKNLGPRTGVDTPEAAGIDRWFFVGTSEQAFMGAVAMKDDRVDEVLPLVRKTLGSIPDVIGFANQGSLFGRSLGGGRSIEVDIRGTDLADMVGFGGQLMGALSGALPGAQIRPIPGLDAGAPELRVEPRRAQAAALGLSSTELGLVVDAYVDGAIIGELGPAGKPKRDVVLRATGIPIDDPDDLAAAPVATATGEPVPLGEVVEVEEMLGPTVIQRIERSRAITLQVSPPKEIPLEEALARVRGTVSELIQGGRMPEGLRVTYSGSAGKLEESQARFGWVLLLAVVIIFLLLAALFEDFLAPLAILVSVPLAATGGVLGLRLVDATLGAQPLDMMTALGFVILIGIVVNNAILIVDGALQRMRHGELGLDDAVAASVRRRVRPILMSALTSLAGLAPLVLLSGAGSELYRGVGSVVLGGLALSTLLSLFIVPTVFATLWRARRLRVFRRG